MNLPHANQPRVDRNKIIDYLLSSTHPDGSSKAEFFGKFGFSTENWQNFAEALRIHGETHPVVKYVESSFGTR